MKAGKLVQMSDTDSLLIITSQQIGPEYGRAYGECLGFRDLTPIALPGQGWR
jgi:hypothetical protein